MRTLICGSKLIYDYNLLTKVYQDSGFTSTAIHSDGDTGIGVLAIRFAYESKLPLRKFPSEWNRFGNVAWVIRAFEACAFSDQIIIIGSRGDSLLGPYFKYAKGCGLRIHHHQVEPQIHTLVKQGREASVKP